MDWKTWSPFQSADTRAVCAHMTVAEKSTAAMRGALYGIWVVVSAAIPLGVAVAHPSWLTLCLSATLIAVHIGCVPVWQRKQKDFLCNTEWAKSQKLAPEDLKLFGRQKR